MYNEADKYLIFMLDEWIDKHHWLDHVSSASLSSSWNKTQSYKLTTTEV